ncbi:MAG: YggS family pyridoxal phosphate-dependent enzyme [Flavobacteriales bacterium]|nr:YggS family pyridoxal phosphate-dependent enzyme [Flavobacteriales bacterium]
MSSASLADRYQRIRASLPPHVELIAVSKTRSVAEIRALYALGHRAFGENYPQELKEKHAQLPADVEWHFIGHLQRSNVKHVVGITRLIHGVDSEKLLDEIEKRAADRGLRVDVLLQVHVAEEDTKHGFAPEELRTIVQQPLPFSRWPHVRFRGLMGMATNTADPGRVSSEFAHLAALFKEIRAMGIQPPQPFDTLSMGMSSDAEVAIAQGSTMVRIGTALFGERG